MPEICITWWLCSTNKNTKSIMLFVTGCWITTARFWWFWERSLCSTVASWAETSSKEVLRRLPSSIPLLCFISLCLSCVCAYFCPLSILIYFYQCLLAFVCMWVCLTDHVTVDIGKELLFERSPPLNNHFQQRNLWISQCCQHLLPLYKAGIIYVQYCYGKIVPYVSPNTLLCAFQFLSSSGLTFFAPLSTSSTGR